MSFDLHNSTSTLEHGIEVRARILDWQFDNLPLNWAGNHGLTQFLNVFSVLAPHTEGWAIRVSRKVRPDIAGASMQREVGGFCGQEARHAEAHQRFNREVIEAQGLDCRRLNASMAQLITGIERWPLQQQVASLCSGEHFIGMVGHWYLQDAPRAQIHPAADRLFTWHCTEEIEHCAVVFDLYDQLYGTDLQATLIKKRALLRVTRMLSPVLFGMWKDLRCQALRLAGESVGAEAGMTAAEVRAVLRALCHQAGSYAHYFRPGFHPWDLHEQYLPRIPKLIEQIGYHPG